MPTTYKASYNYTSSRYIVLFGNASQDCLDKLAWTLSLSGLHYLHKNEGWRRAPHCRVLMVLSDASVDSSRNLEEQGMRRKI